MRPGGEFWFKVEKGAVRKKNKTERQRKSNLAGVQQVFALTITAESTPLLIPATDSFCGTGGRQIWSVSAVKVSLSTPLLGLHGRGEVGLQLNVHYLCMDHSQPVKLCVVSESLTS